MELVRPEQAGYDSERETPSEDLMRVLSGLSAEVRSTLLLVVLEDFSYADVSRITGIPIRTVISLLSSARDRLRRGVDETAVTPLRRVK